MITDFRNDYSIKVDTHATKPGCWDVLTVHILKWNDDRITRTEIGQYTYNYDNMHNTFVPFMQDGKDYALYSRDYTGTRVMSLPDCVDICGEEQDEQGFCPVDFYVPSDVNGQWGLVAGCIWGDDTSWKIQYLDLSRISDGILIRDDRFGYVEMGRDTLKDSVYVYMKGKRVQLTTIQTFDRETGKRFD